MADKLDEILINPSPSTPVEIGIDTNKTILSNIIDAAQVGVLDISSIDALSQSVQSREQVYQLIDSMAADDVIAAVLDNYAEDIVQTNDKGQVVWVEAEDSEIFEYTSWLLDSLNVDKHIFQWAYCLVTYGDVYLRLYRQSDVQQDLLFKKAKKGTAIDGRQLNEAVKQDKSTNESTTLQEDAKLRVYSETDRYIPYVEMVNNPGEMFDLQKFGKTYGYIKAPSRVMTQTTDELYTYLTKYTAKQSDVEIFDATAFVHGCIETTTQRQPETVDIYLDNTPEDDEDEFAAKDSMTSSYNVKRGQSLLYNSFRIWRELNLLEMSALLNRLTKSSVIRILNIDVGDMPKEQIQAFIQRLKEKIEQKSALAVGTGMAEYTNPSPIENTIYVPVHGTQGNITPTTIGGDFDPKSLVDIEYFRDKLFGSLKVPKQFFGFTEDGAGFNGGTSLTILSSRYGKTIKNIQNILCQMLTDVINLFLIDRGLDNFVNKFTVRMQTPTTQEEIDRRTNTDNRIRYIGDLMNQLTDIDDKITKLKIYKALLGSAVNDSEVINHIQSYIETLEAENTPKTDDNAESDADLDMPASDAEADSALPSLADIETSSEEPPLESIQSTEKEVLLEDSEEEDDSFLPSGFDLGIDLLKGDN